MALTGCCQLLVSGLLLLILIVPFAIVEAALCFILGLLFGLFYWTTSCMWMQKARQVRAKGCWLIREAVLYGFAGITFCIVPLAFFTLRGIKSASKSFKFETVPTFIGMVDVNRFYAFRYFSIPALTGASNFDDPPRDSFPLFACCKSVQSAEPASMQMKNEVKADP